MFGHYPHMVFRRNWQLHDRANQCLGVCEGLLTALSRTPILPEYYEELFRLSIIKGAQATTAIEGNTLSDSEIAQVAAGKSVAPSKEYQAQEVRNIIDAYGDITKDAVIGQEPELISPELVKRFHSMVGKDLGEHFDAIPGRFREDARIVRPYRTPDHRDVGPLVERLCAWLREEFHFADGQQNFSDAIVQAIVAHVYIEWIHPFGDGNGRTGRMVEFYILTRAGAPDIASHILSNFYNETRNEYYRQIHQANVRRDLTGFITYAIQGFKDGLEDTLKTVEKAQLTLTWERLIYDKFGARTYRKKAVFIRQRDLALAFPKDRIVTLEEIPVLTTKLAREYASFSAKTVERDLDILMEMGILERVANGYFANLRQLLGNYPLRRKAGGGWRSLLPY